MSSKATVIQAIDTERSLTLKYWFDIILGSLAKKPCNIKEEYLDFGKNRIYEIKFGEVLYDTFIEAVGEYLIDILKNHSPKINGKVVDNKVLGKLLSNALICALEEKALSEDDLGSIADYLEKYCIFSESNFCRLAVFIKELPKVELPKQEFPELVKEVKQERKKDEEGFVASAPKSKKSKKKVVLDITQSSDVLLKRTNLSEIVVEKQKEMFNGWYIGGKGKFATNDSNYIPLMFNADNCLTEKADKKHIEMCTFITCRKCHNPIAVNKAVEENNRLRYNVNATPKEIEEDLSCRIFRANIEGRVSNNRIHDYYTLLQNVSTLNKKYLLTKEHYRKITGIEI